MHLAINSGTDLALFNAWLTYINEKGLTDKAFIAASTNDFDKAVTSQQNEPRGGGADHGSDRRPNSSIGRMDRTAETGRRAAADDVRL